MDFKEAYTYVNVKQIKVLSTVMFVLSSSTRILTFFYNQEITKIPNIVEYNINNLVQIIVSSTFIILSSLALSPNSWTTKQRNLLTLVFTFFVLTITFMISYIYSMHNTKNTLTVFLIGIVVVSIFFSLEFRHIILLSLFVIVLFFVGMVAPGMSVIDQLFNIIASVILAFVLYICSRYSYYFKSEHFTRLKQLEEKNEEIQNLNHEKGEILGFVAHDLRTPLNNIESLSNMLLHDEKDQRIELQLILTSATHAKNIINDLIEVVQERKMPLQMQTINMVDFLKGIRNNWQANTDECRKINFSTQHHEIIANINATKFTRVLDNIIGNGLKFSPLNGPIDISSAADTGFCTIKVTDYGIGIPDHLQKSLFDQFSKSGRPGLRGEKSTGLGLHISKNIIEEHGGKLNVESKEDEGTTFTISIPLRKHAN